MRLRCGGAAILRVSPNLVRELLQTACVRSVWGVTEQILRDLLHMTWQESVPLPTARQRKQAPREGGTARQRRKRETKQQRERLRQEINKQLGQPPAAPDAVQPEAADDKEDMAEDGPPSATPASAAEQQALSSWRATWLPAFVATLWRAATALERAALHNFLDSLLQEVDSDCVADLCQVRGATAEPPARSCCMASRACARRRH
jgi:hypothetical protein